jgi:hypothetical protein
MVRGRLLRWAALPAAFALGWGARAPAAAPRAAAIAALPAAAPTSCIDAAAMKANENLVTQLQEHRRASHDAELLARATQAKLASAVKARAVPARIAPARDEWARMAREHAVRLVTPCAGWDAARRFGGGRGGVVSGGGEVRARASLAGFEDGELEALQAAYEAAHARTWQAMRAACEEGPFFAQAIAESAVTSDADRVAICMASLLPENGEAARGALQRVAESRAAGKGVPGASPEERVAFASSESTDVLFEEMKRTLGEEKAMRAVDYGVLCTDEHVFATDSRD